jgi:hypothetical protein
MTESTAWYGEWWRLEGSPNSKSTNVDDVHFVQPVGFIWFSKPRYRVKCGRRVM